MALGFFMALFLPSSDALLLEATEAETEATEATEATEDARDDRPDGGGDGDDRTDAGGDGVGDRDGIFCFLALPRPRPDFSATSRFADFFFGGMITVI